ncbi:WNT3A protein, partial [Prunella himalayana]|nr:WNT3A protein [Prunella himalayana]
SLAIGHQYSSLGTQPILCGSIPGLVPKQLRFCRNYVEIMPSVAEGVKIGIQECQHQFRGRRWNCTTVNDSLAIFGPVLDKAFQPPSHPGLRLTQGLWLCCQGTGLAGCPGVGQAGSTCSRYSLRGLEVQKRFGGVRRVWRFEHHAGGFSSSIIELMHLKCKCHGLSGSCEVKTCWWSQPDFRVIGDYLKDKYDSASEMVVEKHRESRGWVETLRPKYNFFKAPTEKDLVYYENSPNFCEPNPETGSFGTRDRICNVTSHGIDGCDLLCCGRGHNTRTEKRKEKCHCIFHWCCYVRCQECIRVYDVHTCK